MQSIEGAIDSSHTTILHQDNVMSGGSIQASTIVSGKGEAVQVARPSADKHPRMQVRDTRSGFIYGALRKSLHDPETMNYVRATAYAFPSYVAFTVSEPLRAQLIFVPIDEVTTHFYSIWYCTTAPMDRAGRIAWSGLDPARDLDEDGYLRICSLPNWGQDRAAMAAGRSFAGLNGINVQDTIVQESMGAVVDRTKEHLGAADLGIVHFRRLMLAVARGEAAAATAEFATGMRYALRARDGLVRADSDWTSLYAEGEVNWLPQTVGAL